MSRVVVIALDDSDCSHTAAHWWCTNWVRSKDVVHLVGVIGPVSAGMSPALPMGTAGAVAALHVSYREEYEREEARCNAVLRQAKKALADAGAGELHAHALPAAGGASGVAESIAAWAKKENADLVVVGSRGMGAAKSTLMSLVGLGSVSSYVLHHLERIPVCLVRGKGLEGPRKARAKVLVAVDDSEAAQRAQRWAEDNALGPNDELHLVTVAFPVPYVIATEDAAAAYVLEAEESEGDFKDSRSYARDTVAAAVEAAAKKVDRARIMFKALEPEGGASEVGLSILHYAQANDIDLVVMGSRGVGAVKRALLALVGLGSVSEWCAHNLKCPVVIVK